MIGEQVDFFIAQGGVASYHFRPGSEPSVSNGLLAIMMRQITRSVNNNQPYQRRLFISQVDNLR
jgi:hypothetical protein